MKIPPVPTPPATPSAKLGSFLSANKKVICIVAAVALAALYCLSRYFSRADTLDANKPSDISLEQKPSPTLNVDLNTSLKHAKISIQTSPDHPLSNANIVFCRDTRGIANDDHTKSLRTGFESVLKEASKFQEDGLAQTDIAIIQFDESLETLCEPTRVQPDTLTSLTSKQFKHNRATNVTTDTLGALELATSTLEKMAKDNPEATQTLIFTTIVKKDITVAQLEKIHARLAAIGARVHAIGTGTHNAVTLRNIARPTPSNYIDASAHPTRTENRIAEAYKQATAPYRDLMLQCTQLKPGTWSLNSKSSEETAEGSKCTVPDFFYEQPDFRGLIKIHRKKLEAPLDLSTLSFTLSFTDFRGQKGSIPVPWKVNPVIVPDLAKL